MDPLIILVLVLVGLPVLSLIVVVLFTATADYEPIGVTVRGGSLRGVVAGAIAKVLVGDAKTFQLPLRVQLQKIGILGASTPLVGGATVRDIEWRVFLDGEHVSTVTEASSVRVGSRQRHLELPVNAEVHLPGGLLRTYRRLRDVRAAHQEVRIDVKGHVIVRHWMMARELPVRVTQHVLLGPGRPLLQAELQAAGSPGVVATADLALSNPYRGTTLEGDLRVEVVAARRLRMDPVVARWEERVVVPPGAVAARAFRLMPGVDLAAPDVERRSLRLRVRWDGDVLAVQGPEPAGNGPLVPADEVVVPWPDEAPTARLVPVHR